ncbi:MAG: DoxX family protein [Bacteroidetes bacterium]|nr:DoxX family protein [Bacteroidota bacterium]
MLLNSEEVSNDLGVLVLRISAAGTLFWQHGWPKLMHFSEKVDHFSDPIGLGPAFSLVLILIAEVLCSALVLLGLWTRLTTIPPIIGMAVAAFLAHGDDPFAKKELAVLYMAAFIALFFTGSGRFSLDRLKFQ